jgi:L-seryl-tRNA(Ser) seleniumtransferase
MTAEHSLRGIPSVDKILKALGGQSLPRPVVLATVRSELARLREEGRTPDIEEIIGRIKKALSELRLSRIQPVINGAGVVVHTNLGRAPLPSPALELMEQTGAQYNNLEFDLAGGERGHRGAYLEHLLALLCSSEAATVVNNCAAALVLILRHFTSRKKEVLISRGELIQIGGGFRIPDILESSGAQLREVGATNKTTVEDYQRALSPETALILKVHRSNFYMEGFVESPPTEELARLARAHETPLVEDLGSGAVYPTEKIAFIQHEPTPEEILRQGVDLVCFSGDKLLGGPQAGIIAGRKELVKALKKEPFFRALRCDKLILAGLQATAELYLEATGATSGGSPGPPPIPVLQMLNLSREELKKRADAILESLRGLPAGIQPGEGESEIGGGTLPRSKIPSVTIDIEPREMSLEKFADNLRRGSPPVVGYVSGGKFRVDLRAVFPGQDQSLAAAIRAALSNP